MGARSGPDMALSNFAFLQIVKFKRCSFNNNKSLVQKNLFYKFRLVIQQYNQKYTNSVIIIIINNKLIIIIIIDHFLSKKFTLEN